MWPNEQKPNYGLYLKTKIENETAWRHNPRKSLEKAIISRVVRKVLEVMSNILIQNKNQAWFIVNK